MSSTSLSESLLTLKSRFAEKFKESHDGDMTGFAAAWRDAEPDMLIAAKSMANDAQGKKATADAKKLKRSKMSIAEKAEFVEKHGLDAYKDLEL